MSETKSEHRHPAARRGARTLRLTLAAVALIGAGAVIGVVATEAHGHEGWRYWKGWRHHGPVASEAEALERARKVAARVLGKVEATGAQREQVDALLEAFVAEAWPLGQQHRENRRALVKELTRPEVSREALAELRVRELALAERFSGALLDALVALSSILDAGQRVALAERFAHRRHHRDH